MSEKMFIRSMERYGIRQRTVQKSSLEKFWGRYFSIERGIYEQLLTEPDVEVKRYGQKSWLKNMDRKF